MSDDRNVRADGLSVADQGEAGAGYGQELERSTGFWGLLAYGLVFMVPVAPFAVYGFVSRDSFGMVPFIYLVGLVVMAFTALSYSRMSAEFPISGSVYSYVQRGLNSHVGFLAGWLILADYLLAPGLLYGLTGVLLNAVAPSVPVWIFVLAFVVVNTLIAARGITLTNWADFVLLGIQLVVLAVFVVFAITYVFVNGGGAGGLSLDPLLQPGRVDFGFVAAATSIAVFSFLGFDGISTLGEETERPERNIGRATMVALIVIGVLFFVQTYLAALVHPDYQSLDPNLGFFEIGQEAGGAFLYYLLILVSVLAFGIANTLVLQVAVSRILYSIGRDEMLPASGFLSRVHPRYRTPVNATVLVGVLTFVVALLFSTETLVKFVNFGALTAFMLLNLSVFAYFYIRRGRRGLGGFVNFALLPLAGFAIIAYVWLGFDAGTFVFGFSWLAVGAIIGAVKSKGYTKKPPTLDKI